MVTDAVVPGMIVEIKQYYGYCRTKSVSLYFQEHNMVLCLILYVLCQICVNPLHPHVCLAKSGFLHSSPP